MTPTKERRPISSLEALASVELTLFCLVLAMVLVLFGTLAQVRLGTFAAQKEFFNSWWLYRWFGDTRVPVFPGGLAVGTVWMVNLIAAFITRFSFEKKNAGNLLSHFGIILLLLGQLLTQLFARESQMPIEIGQTSNYSEAFRDTEIALTKTSDSNADEVTSIPYSIFSHKTEIKIPNSSFTLRIKRFFRNAQLGMATTSESLATQGIGTRIAIQEIPPTYSDEEMNAVSAYVEVLDGDRSLGTWLLSSVLGAPQGFTTSGNHYQIALRQRRYYYSFSITLKDFRHDRYAGTEIPKNFSSSIELRNAATGENRNALIYMNHPLRYEGHTFYQASFGKGDRLSVFQVVKNPAWLTPYISCALVVLGLLITFMTHLLDFIRKRK